MSYSFRVEPTNVDDLEQSLVAALDDVKATLNPSADEQARTAIAAAVAVAKSGHLGSGQVTATISGHANPDHEPRPGWSNDMLTIGLYASTPKPSE